MIEVPDPLFFSLQVARPLFEQFLSQRGPAFQYAAQIPYGIVGQGREHNPAVVLPDSELPTRLDSQFVANLLGNRDLVLGRSPNDRR